MGFGRIGRNVARMALGFGMMVLAYDPGLQSDVIRFTGVEPVESLMEGLCRADIISLHAPRCGEIPLIGACQFSAMKPSSFIVNTARGGLIDE